eukprot:TRINITY_DN10631_c0_g1_i2.p1 TRINITY_DN10631_c0_g1~~TRINITY_DN10631_c0_g1_i2.p1  ORF type:complete len:247 (-),score=43.74 TRINITY_DN10631_c0_g1_i2:116-856(-)
MCIRDRLSNNYKFISKDNLLNSYLALFSSINLFENQKKTPINNNNQVPQKKHIITEIDLSKKSILTSLNYNYKIVPIKQKEIKRKFQNKSYSIAGVSKITENLSEQFEPKIMKKTKVNKILEQPTNFFNDQLIQNKKFKNLEELFGLYGTLVFQSNEESKNDAHFKKLSEDLLSLDNNPIANNFQQNNNHYFELNNYQQLQSNLQEFDDVAKFLQLESNLKTNNVFNDDDLFKNYSLEINYNTKEN